MGRRLLIIDDEWSIRQVLEARLVACGFEVATAGDGSEGLDAARRSSPDVILLDLRMPDMDGFEVFRQLRAHDRTRGVPVIFLTANIQDTAKDQARAAGAAGFLTKPYEASAVLEAIGAAMPPAMA